MTLEHISFPADIYLNIYWWGVSQGQCLKDETDLDGPDWLYEPYALYRCLRNVAKPSHKLEIWQHPDWDRDNREMVFDVRRSNSWS